MRGLRVSSNGTKGLAELNQHEQKEVREVRDGVAGGGQGLSDEDESRINKNELTKLPLVVSQRPLVKPQGQQGNVVSWERFLPFGTLKVLLVEFDDSTRHLVSALLRNCSYEVTAVANGIEAWRILADLTNHIDLVLTEVAMPYLSGIGLLNKIMSHKTCKNIPVIMMSSNDSMGIVFKCLSKGAVDFLVKPIRKNELKNLWQHVWRKCHSSSGSGSESGIRTQKSSKSKSVEGIGNNNVSNDEDDIASISLNDRNGSDNGSGTQSSWTKRAIEVDSPRAMSPWDELADAPDSTCAQDIHVKNNWVPKSATKKLQRNDKNDDIAMGIDLEIGAPRDSDLQIKDQNKEFHFAVSGAQEGKDLEAETDKDGSKLEKDKIDLNGDTSNDKSREEVADLIGAMNCANNQMDGVNVKLPGDLSNTDIKDEGMYDPKEIPSLVLSLKRQRDVGEVDDTVLSLKRQRDVGEVDDTVREQNVLRRSNLSAFSRYNIVSTANQTLTGNVGSCSPHDNSSEADKTENLQNPNQRSNGSSNNNDMGSTTNNTFANLDSSDKTAPKSTVNLHPASAFQPVRNSHTAVIQPVTPNKGDDATVNTVLAKANDISSQVQVQHHHHHYHHHHHHVHKTQQQKKAAKADDISLRAVVGSPTGLTTPIEGNAASYSLNGSASGSYNGSNNGQNGSSNAVVTEGVNIGGENGLNANCGINAGGGSGSGVEQSRHAHREAALNKFRQKRKERCFDKKVRYQSRKKLAEQRPRVRGQFVRQGVCDNNKNKDTDC